ncbi:MAG: chemotaxis protein CheV [bacterium]|nr:chemotaxis protein CheV [bacterium]
MAEKILLESGNNELELLVFHVAGTSYGINVAKVREIISDINLISLPDSPESVDGTFKLRDKILALVNLKKRFKPGCEAISSEDTLVIIIEFNNQQYGMLVDDVDRIHRLKWDQIDPPASLLTNLDAPITAIAKVEGETVLIPDIEGIFKDIFGGINEDDVSNNFDFPESRKKAKILIADDSAVIRRTLISRLNKNGFLNLIACNDGREAWERLEDNLNKDETQFDVIISDIEMPRMDGLHFTKKIKTHPVLKNIPVILFSSIISEDNRNKGEQVGADAQITKFQDGELVELIDSFLKKMDE